MNKINISISLLNLLVIGTFWYRFSCPIVTSTASFFSSSDFISAFLAAQANQHALLQIYLVAVSIAIAAAAFWGYSQIKTEVLKSVLDKINETVPSQVEKTLNSLDPEMLGEIFVKAKMQDTAATNANEHFEDAKQVFGDPDEQKFP